MIQFKQFADSVTGSKLPPQFRQTRVKLSILIFIVLALLLLLSGLNVSEQTRIGFERLRQQTIQEQNELVIIRNQPGQQADLERPRPEVRRLQIFRQLELLIILSNISLLVLLSFLSWIGLYYLLLPLAKATIEKEKFLSQASHELRTPLAILYSELSLSATETDLAELRKVHLASLEEIKRLQSLSDVLLGRQDQNSMQLELQDLVEKVWDSLQPLNNRKFNLKIQGKAQINTQQTLFYQLVYNLIANAIEHADPVSEIQVRLSAGQVSIQNLTSETDYQPGLGLQTCHEVAQILGLKLQSKIIDRYFMINIEWKSD